eukprot:4994472-Amphidinium_carterae.1
MATNYDYLIDTDFRIIKIVFDTDYTHSANGWNSFRQWPCAVLEHSRTFLRAKAVYALTVQIAARALRSSSAITYLQSACQQAWLMQQRLCNFGA